jgi:transcriptional regulator with XRE-family HTH domain
VAPPVDPTVARARFAIFVDRALRIAREAGMSDREVQRVSGVATSTFHRWRNQETKSLPRLAQVRAFCEATGANVAEAMAALGMSDNGPSSAPEPPLPREIRIIMRRLEDPHTSEVEKDFIRQSLQMLAGRIAAVERSEQKARDAG